MGAEFTIADLYTHYMFAVASAVATRVVNVDLLGDRPRIAELLERLAVRPSIARVTAEMAA
jgi:glutathione S-transferase